MRNGEFAMRCLIGLIIAIALWLLLFNGILRIFN